MKKKSKFNKSKTYLLPLISDYIGINSKYLPYLKNTYLNCNKDEYKNCFFILHDFNFKDKDFTAYEHELMNNNLFIEAHDINNQVLYVFKFPEDHLEDYKAFTRSEYSKISEGSKHKIMDYWDKSYGKNPNALKVLTKVKNILYKENKLKNELEVQLGVTINEEAELGEFIDINKETFEFEKLSNES